MSIWGNTMTNIKQTASDIVSGIVEIWDGIKGKFDNIWTSLKESASTFFTWIGEKFKWVGDSVDKIKGIGTWVSNGIGDAAASVGWNAKGNVFGGPSIIGVGEAGNEAVIPLSGKNMLPFAQAIADVMPSSNASSGYSNSRPINNVNRGNNGSSNSSNDAILGQILQQTSNQNKTIEVPVYIDGKQVAKAVANYVDRENRR
jgi:phage-related protein